MKLDGGVGVPYVVGPDLGGLHADSLKNFVPRVYASVQALVVRLLAP